MLDSKRWFLPQILAQRVNEMFKQIVKGQGRCDSGVMHADTARCNAHARSTFQMQSISASQGAPSRNVNSMVCCHVDEVTGELCLKMAFPVIRSHNSVEAFFHNPSPKTAGIGPGLIPNPLVPRRPLIAPWGKPGRFRQLAGSELNQISSHRRISP
jgi:hypothetical protein